MPDYAKCSSGISQIEIFFKSTGAIPCLNEKEISSMRKVCKYAREIVEMVREMIRPGVTCDEINQLVHKEAIKRNCYPSPLNYNKFPRSCCTSINEIACHGIPDYRPLKSGDIISVDISLFHQEFHGDLCETFLVGNAQDPLEETLIDVAKSCLVESIKLVRPGVPFSDLGSLIEQRADEDGLNVVSVFTGHGIHRVFHAPPNILHYRNSHNEGIMKVGNVFTIEPIITSGTGDIVIWPDGWTAATRDGEKAAQFEQTVLVTPDGFEILTA